MRLSSEQLSARDSGQLWQTLKEIRKHKNVALFLLSYWVYIDGVHTVIRDGNRLRHVDRIGSQRSHCRAAAHTSSLVFPQRSALASLPAVLTPKLAYSSPLPPTAQPPSTAILWIAHWNFTSLPFHHRTGAGRGAVPVTLAVRHTHPQRKLHAVFRFLQHDGQIRYHHRPCHHGTSSLLDWQSTVYR